jgi:hypothetical protein
MTVEPRDGMEAVWLWAFRRLTPRDQFAAIDAGQRMLDGQPIEACMVEMFVDMGETLAMARQRVREVSRGGGPDWRNALN